MNNAKLQVFKTVKKYIFLAQDCVCEQQRHNNIILMEYKLLMNESDKLMLNF